MRKYKFRRWLRSWLNNFDSDVPEEAKLCSVSESNSIREDPILNFKVFNAVGGRVVEFTSYDRKSDRRYSTTYIITNDQDFGERIAKIAVMENLKA
jgi:hypothetical protein